jgi:hypothetical protein
MSVDGQMRGGNEQSPGGIANRMAYLVLAGVGRAGTTSLFWYLSQHPDVCVSAAKESRFFIPLSEIDEGATGVLPPIGRYEEYFEHCSNERYRMEATPGYFHGGPRLIRGLKGTLGEPRILVMLRNPITRIWSTYRYAKARLLVPATLTFEQYVEQCEEVDRDRRARPASGQAYWEIRASRYTDYIEPWFEEFGDAFRVVFFEDLADRPMDIVQGLCRWLGIDTAPVASFDFSVENRSISYRSRTLQRLALAANRERFFRKHHKLKTRLRNLYYRINERGRQEQMSVSVKEHLVSLFAPSNERLAAQLTVRGYRNLPYWLKSLPTTRS